MKRLVCLLCLAALSSTPFSMAAHHRYWHGVKAYHHPVKQVRPQQHVSFLPPRQPVMVSPVAGSPLTGRVEHQKQIESPNVASVAPATVLQPIAPLSVPPKAPTGTPSQKKSRSSLRGVERAWVSHVNRNQVSAIAQSVADFAATTCPPESTTVFLAPLRRRQKSNPLTPEILQALRRKGFAITNALTPEAQILVYQVNPLDSGLLLRLRLHGMRASRFFTLSRSNEILSYSPFSIQKTPGEKP